MNFGNEITKILAAESCCPSKCEVPEVLVQDGVPKGKPIKATKLPKMGGKKKRIVATKLPKSWGGILKKKKIVAIDLWQWHCRNGGKKSLWQLNCRNGREKNVAIDLWQCCC